MKRRALLGTAAATAAALAGCGDPNETKGTKTNAVPKDYTRHVDCKAGIVIYEQNTGEGGFETVPINETDLEKEDVCNE